MRLNHCKNKVSFGLQVRLNPCRIKTQETAKLMNKTVLIIDDDDLLRTTLARGLRTSGFYVVNAENADTATNILNRLSVDAIVLDRMMVGMDGLTFMKKLRKSGNNTPIIMLTAMGGAENAIDGLSNGANDYLAKPFQLRELILRLNNIIQRNSDETQKMPNGLIFTDDEFFISESNGHALLSLSGEEKKLLCNLTCPIGNIVPASPMVAKRLRNKINGVLSNLDIVTVRGRGYKLVQINKQEKQ